MPKPRHPVDPESAAMKPIFSYSFSLTPQKPQEPEPLDEYSYSEFYIDLARHWKQIPTPIDNTINFHSEQTDAGITISTEFYEIPDAKAQAIAQKCLESRVRSLKDLDSESVIVLQQTIRPHSGGIGLELSLVAEIPEKHVYIYLGYVTSRKILSFTLVCKQGRQEAAELFNKTIENYRPRLP
jgi:hypothetical protein